MCIHEYLYASIGIDKAENELVKVQITDFSDHTLRSHAERLVRPRVGGGSALCINESLQLAPKFVFSKAALF